MISATQHARPRLPAAVIFEQDKLAKLLRGARALGRKPDKPLFLENWTFVSPVVFANYHA
jgi:hypothetical protein